AQVIATLQGLLQQLESPCLRNSGDSFEGEENCEDNRCDEEDDDDDIEEDDDDNDGDSDDGDDDNDDDDNGGDDNGDNDDDDDDDDDDCEGHDTKGYVCADVQCRGRKPDKTFKQYSRHHDTHAKCRVTCAGCGRNLLRVSILKRHVTTCRTLKKKQNIPQHKTAMNKMKQKLKKAAAKASQEARASLEASKRLNAMVADDTNPRKRMRLGECQNFLTPINSEEVHETIVDSNDFSRACQVVNLSSTQNRVRFNTKTSEFDKCANNFSKGQDPVNGATMHHPQVSAAQKSAIDLSTPSSHSTVIQYLATDAHRPILGADSHYPVQQDPTASEDSSYLLSTMDRSFAKDQFPAEQNSTTLRASSFFLNTMDGSFPDTQFLEEHNAKAIRGSSFLTNTMDGSYYPSNWSPQEFA
ncbi:unnamed protein product, partial [Clonostachys chloroleuca]